MRAEWSFSLCYSLPPTPQYRLVSPHRIYMRKLTIPEALKTEFATVEAIWNTDAEARRVDALALSWVKYEKQLRRLFSFFVFQHTTITADTLDDAISAFAGNSKLYPETFIAGIEALGLKSLPQILGETHGKLWPEIVRIKDYRNKIMHGQLTGQKIQSPQIEKDVIFIVDWVSAVANAANAEFGYDGLKRNTYKIAKSCPTVHVQNFPFTSTDELKAWLIKLAKKSR